ncbi:hypothetical protein ACFV2Z_22620 [Streptomyces sp. NPDC059688]
MIINQELVTRGRPAAGALDRGDKVIDLLVLLLSPRAVSSP